MFLVPAASFFTALAPISAALAPMGTALAPMGTELAPLHTALAPPTTALSPAAESLGHLLPLASMLPFAAILLAIALLPLTAGHWWERNRNKGLVGLIVGAPFAAWLVLEHGDRGLHALHEVGLDYVSFLSMLGALYVISGGIYVRGSLAGTPLSNTGILGIGAILANFIGTTGASMVLIRPLLRANKTRERKTHIVVFFLFVVSNCGGLLTPLGDPPLLLGFLKGVPFEWTLGLWKEWLVVNGILLLVFQMVDSYVLDREEKERPGSQLEDVLRHEPVGLEGKLNLLLLLGVLATVIARGQGLGSASGTWPFGVQEGLMIGLAALSFAATKRELHVKNQFTFGPIVEVAILFAAIFTTMIAPILILNARASELGVTEPWQFFWATGLLSSFLDNAPTYLTFGAMACGQAGVSVTGAHYLGDLLATGAHGAAVLSAITCGAVMMGANTYIGNGPNFMVKAIAEHSGIKMPSFLGYMGWSATVLLPTFVVVTLLFFAHG